MKSIEHKEQCAVIRWAQLSLRQYPELAMLHAIPNGGLRSKVTAMRMKAEGQKPGVPDLSFPVARQGFHGLYIEMKRQKGGVISDSQKWWHENLRKYGYMVMVCKGADEAIHALQEYLG